MTNAAPQSPEAGPSRQAAVRALRERVEQQPGERLVTSREEILGLLVPPAPPVNGDGAHDDDEIRYDPPRYAQSLLAQHGIRAVPPLTLAAGDVTLSTSRSYAVQGALAVTAVATLLGFVGYWAYGLLFAAAGVVATSGLAAGFDALRRALPPVVPRGRVLGAGVALAAILVVLVAGVIPIRDHRNAVGRARGLVVQADQAINAGQLDLAQAKLFAAEGIVDHPPLIDDVRAHLQTARIADMLKTQAVQQAVYDRAERAFERGDAKAAIRLAEPIRGFADVDQRLRDYRRAAARAASGR